MKPSTLIVITGPTGSGKTDLAIGLAQILNCEIISADSRQIYSGIPIGTATPSKEQMANVPHHLVSFMNLDQYYSAACFEEDVMNLLPQLFAKSSYAILCGGSMMYIDAVLYGIDQLPTISHATREAVLYLYKMRGIDAIIKELQQRDPAYLATADLSNHRRLIHAVEICRDAGVPHSSLRTGHRKVRPFKTVRMMIDYPRATLFERINARVDKMIEAGFVDEARSVYPLRHLNSLNTVGYKELFAHFDGKLDLSTAISRIKKNTRVYAKKQLTWLAKNSADLHRLNPSSQVTDALKLINIQNAPQQQ